jgi:hypothetical protein
MPGKTWIAAAVAIAAAAVPALAASRPRATAIRIGSHAAYVRVVVDFRGAVPDSHVEYAPGGSGRFTMMVQPARSSSLRASGAGVSARIAASSTEVRLRVSGRSAYVAYHELSAPSRLVVDLVRPYSAAALTVGSCFAITSVASHPGVVDVRGRVRVRPFEGQWNVVLRDRHGHVVAQRHVTGGLGAFHYQLHHSAATQPGDVDVYALSAKDGALSCLARRGVALRH